MASQQQSGRAASMARRQLQKNGQGRSAAATAPTRQPNRRERKPVPAATATPAPAPQAAAPSFAAPAPSMPRQKPAQKSASRLRRESLASRGKRAETSKDRQRDSEMALKRRSAAEAKASKGDCGCGGPCCQEAEAKAAAAAAPAASYTAPASNGVVAKRKPVMNASNSGRMMSRARRAAMAGRGKAGLEAHGKNSSASLARQANPDISARDLAKTVRESRSKNGSRGSAASAPARARRPRNAAEAKQISGTKVGHTEKLTGDEVGLCNAGITGTEYMASEVFDKFCQAEPPKAPKKVERTETLSGSVVTSGGKVGGSATLTGAEEGSCREITGSEYLGREHFAQQCEATPAASPAKVSTSKTTRGLVISGPRSERSDKVTGNRKGTCKAISGTPYAGSEQFESFCSTDEQRATRQASVMPRPAAREISGIQPGLEEGVTGTESGACQAISGTPYISESDLNSVCGAAPSKPGDADFPQALNNSIEVAGEFSVAPTVADAPVAPAAVAPAARSSSVTGAGYENEGPITGAFSMGQGKVTGTEQARFGDRSSNVVVAEPKPEEAAVPASRVTGEGIETGLRITGDDWDRGDRVTGTEGSTAVQRNPSRRGAMTAMPDVANKREPQVARESANVTGGSGGSQGTAFITVSGGARG